MQATIVYPKHKLIKQYIQYFLFIKNDDPHYRKSHICFPNTNSCIGLHKSNKLLPVSETDYKDSLDITPKEFLNISRFRKGINELNKIKKLTQVAYETGYSDQSHMIREFKKYTGFTSKGNKFSSYSPVPSQ